ncbi:MAG: hypothetical protein MAG453_00707 [Calditrichaeota bacterium]|nr:hypothetical protein [Calditrichota bacterium]
MTIAGILCVRNERRYIVTNLRYHLDTQGFDFILVIDNGSYDNTRELVAGMNDARVKLVLGERRVRKLESEGELIHLTEVADALGRIT